MSSLGVRRLCSPKADAQESDSRVVEDGPRMKDAHYGCECCIRVDSQVIWDQRRSRDGPLVLQG